jgi:hypothetical protein
MDVLRRVPSASKKASSDCIFCARKSARQDHERQHPPNLPAQPRLDFFRFAVEKHLNISSDHDIISLCHRVENQSRARSLRQISSGPQTASERYHTRQDLGSLNSCSELSTPSESLRSNVVSRLLMRLPTLRAWGIEVCSTRAPRSRAVLCHRGDFYPGHSSLHPRTFWDCEGRLADELFMNIGERRPSSSMTWSPRFEENRAWETVSLSSMRRVICACTDNAVFRSRVSYISMRATTKVCL